MITTWLLRTLLVGLLLGIAALAAERVSGWMGGARRWVWSAAMVGSLIIPALALWAPGIVPQIGVAAGWLERLAASDVGAPTASDAVAANAPVEISSAVAVPGSAGEHPGTGEVAHETSWGASALNPSSPEFAGSALQAAVASQSTAAPAGAFRADLGERYGNIPVAPLAALWVLLSLAVTGVIAWGSARLRLMRAESAPAVVDGVRVRLSRTLGPAVVGLVRPEVVIPRWVLGAPEEERKLILAHEQEHIAAKDTWLLALGMFVLAVMPWNPVLWWQHRRLRLAVETDCDARVVANGASRRTYGQVLLRAASGARVAPWLSPAWGETQTHLERRILAITARRPRYGSWLAIPVLVTALVAGLVACDVAKRGRPASGLAPETVVTEANPAVGEPEHVAIAAASLPAETVPHVDASNLNAPADLTRSVPDAYATSGSLPHAVPPEAPFFFERPPPVAPTAPTRPGEPVTWLRPPSPIAAVDAELAVHLGAINVHHAETVRMHQALEEQHRRMDQEFQIWQAVLEAAAPQSLEQWQAAQRAEVAVLRMQDAVLATSAEVLHAQPATLRSEPRQLEVREVPIVEAVRLVPHGMISGVITDAEGRIVRNAPVTLQPLRRGTVTNEDGQFMLHDIPPGTYTLVGVRPNTGRMIRREVEVEGGDRQTIHIVF